ncbi:MAG: GTP-binding protein [Pseudomonadota bacterium]
MSDTQIPVAILTGFLGAGKTSFLNRMLKEPALSDAAVIINEFGDIALDHILVEESADAIIELSSGCLCCSLRGELVETLTKIVAHADRADRSLSAIIIETTGLADPIPVMKAVMAHPALGNRLRLGPVTTMVDAVSGQNALRDYPEAVRQVIVSDRILITKTDLIDDAIPSGLITALSGLNSRVEIMLANEEQAFDPMHLVGLIMAGPGGNNDLPIWLVSPPGPKHEPEHGPEGPVAAVAQAQHSHASGDVAHQDSAIQSYAFASDVPVSFGAFTAFLELLRSAHGEKLLRVKGLIKIKEHPEEPMLIHLVQSVMHEPVRLSGWPDGRPETRIVVIADGLSNEFLRRLYNGFANVPEIDAPDRAALADNPLAIPGFPG